MSNSSRKDSEAFELLRLQQLRLERATRLFGSFSAPNFEAQLRNTIRQHLELRGRTIVRTHLHEQHGGRRVVARKEQAQRTSIMHRVTGDVA